MGTKNKLSDLNDHLFVALERLNDDDMTIEKLELEDRRVKAISSVSNQIISAANLLYKAALSIGKGDMSNKDIPDNFDIKRIQQ